MNQEEKAQYRKLQRQVGEAYSRLFDQGTGGRIPNRSPNNFNNRLQRMKDFLSGLTDGDYSNNRFMKMQKL